MSPALPFILPVTAVTLACCLFAMRWAAEQFNTESVLFRESERLDMGLWFKSLLRDREDTPTVPAAVFCGVLILMVRFFMSFALQKQDDLAQLTIVTQLVVVATPALLMTIMLTRSPRQTLLLNWPRWTTLPAAVLLAVALHPVSLALQALVSWAYPLNKTLAEELKRLPGQIDGNWLWLLAIIPPLCEELAFRGFILSGLRHMGHKWRAIVVSSLFFGVSHAIFQQSISASIMGLVLGYLAVQTGSLLPSILFHVTHNVLIFLVGKLTPSEISQHPLLRSIANPDDESGRFYHWPVLFVGMLLAAGVFYWLHCFAYAALPKSRCKNRCKSRSISPAPSRNWADRPDERHLLYSPGWHRFPRIQLPPAPSRSRTVGSFLSRPRRSRMAWSRLPASASWPWEPKRSARRPSIWGTWPCCPAWSTLTRI